MAPRIKSLEEKLWCKVKKGDPDECWLIQSSIGSHGYGVISHGRGSNLLSHRIAWEVTFGRIPRGLHVRHKCDVRACCNPSHLELGTHLDNMRDRDERGRTSHKGRSKQETCQRGHDDWYIQKSDGRRRCRICRNAAARKRNRDIPDEPFGSEK